MMLMYSPQVTLVLALSRREIQTTNLEEIILLFYQGFLIGVVNLGLDFGLCALGFQSDLPFNRCSFRQRKPPSFIDHGELFDDVIVKTVETDQQRADARGKCAEPGLIETIRLEFAVFE